VVRLKPQLIKKSPEETASREPKPAGEVGKEYDYLSLLRDWLLFTLREPTTNFRRNTLGFVQPIDFYLTYIRTLPTYIPGPCAVP
jgi:hypothetical protein